MLSQTAFMQLTKSEMYNLYSQVFNKLEQKENLIEKYIRQKNTVNQEEQPSGKMGTVSTRNFPVYQLKETQKTWLSAVV